MDEDFYFEESNPKKAKLIFVIILIIISLCCIGFIYYRSKYTLNIKKEITYEIGSEISNNISDYVTSNIIDESDYTLLLSSVSMEDNVLNKVGEYTYKVKYKNITKSGTIKVIDTVAPTVEVSDLTVGVDEEYSAEDFLSTCDDYSKPCTVTYKDESDSSLSSTQGEYSVNLIVSDSVGNKVNVTGKLIVKKNYNRAEAMTSDLKIDHISPEDSSWDKTMVIKYDEAYDPNEIDDTDAYTELMEVTGSDLHDYLPDIYYNNAIVDTQIIEVYNKYDLIIGYAIKVKLDNGLSFYLEKEESVE